MSVRREDVLVLPNHVVRYLYRNDVVLTYSYWLDEKIDQYTPTCMQHSTQDVTGKTWNLNNSRRAYGILRTDAHKVGSLVMALLDAPEVR